MKFFFKLFMLLTLSLSLNAFSQNKVQKQEQEVNTVMEKLGKIGKDAIQAFDSKIHASIGGAALATLAVYSHRVYKTNLSKSLHDISKTNTSITIWQKGLWTETNAPMTFHKGSMPDKTWNKLVKGISNDFGEPAKNRAAKWLRIRNVAGGFALAFIGMAIGDVIIEKIEAKENKQSGSLTDDEILDLSLTSLGTIHPASLRESLTRNPEMLKYLQENL